MNTIEILVQTIDALSKYASSLEAKLDAAGVKFEKLVNPKTVAPGEPANEAVVVDNVDASPETVCASTTNLIQGRDKKTKQWCIYPEGDPGIDSTIKSTRYAASIITDSTGINIADQNVLRSKDNIIAVCHLFDSNILMIDFNTGKTLHKLPLIKTTEPTKLQESVDKEGWTIFTTTWETPSYGFEEDTNDR